MSEVVNDVSVTDSTLERLAVLLPGVLDALGCNETLLWNDVRAVGSWLLIAASMNGMSMGINLYTDLCVAYAAAHKEYLSSNPSYPGGALVVLVPAPLDTTSSDVVH